MWDFRARPLIGAGDYYDGDTFRILADTGFGQRYEPELRLAGVHAPEMKQAGGPETRQFVNNWFATVDARRAWPLYVVTEQTTTWEPVQRRSFTRYVATVWRYGEHPTGVSLNAAVEQFLAEHPGWGGGTGAGRAG